jgi:hypothetical protein
MKPVASTIAALLVPALLFCAEPVGPGQTSPVPEGAGQAEVALQGYYMGGQGQSLTGIAGIAANSTQFIPGFGLVSTSLEGYGSNGLRTGNLFLGVQGLARWGWHWDLTGGDFRFSANLVANPFNNVYIPEISGRGFRVVMKRSNRSYQLFFGKDSVLGGPRIPYRTLLPQLALGGAVQQKIGERWELGARYLRLSTSPEIFQSQTPYALPGHTFLNSQSLTVQSTYTIIPGADTKGLKIYSEAGYGRATSIDSSQARQRPFSFLAGPSWEADKFSFKANYVEQSATYLPLLGIFAGDRKGPYAEGHLRPFTWVDLYGSGTIYSNNLEQNPDLPTFHSKGYSTGASFTLPWKFNLAGSLSTIRLTQHDPSRQADEPSDNRQVNISLGRPVGRHSLRASVIDMKLDTNNQLQHQRFFEAGDTFGLRWLVLGGSVRLQRSRSTESRNTLFYRGSAQFTYRRFSAYANVEIGKDMVNQSVFSMNAFNTTLFGVSAPLVNGWMLHAEAFKNTLNTELNPENVFLFANAGLGANTQLAALNQWSVFFRISKQFHWGKGLPSGGNLAQYAATRVPLVGTVQGFVTEQALNGTRPAANVAVSVDTGRTVLTDANGHYLMSEVPEGSHEVALNLEQLPTDYEPGPEPKTRAAVAPRGMVRADFTVFRLTALAGKVVAPKDAPVESVILRLKDTKLYTTPDADGSFGFSNLREGHYEVAIDEKTIPEGYILASAPSISADANATEAALPVVFEIKVKPAEIKPVREMKLQSQPIRVGGK